MSLENVKRESGSVSNDDSSLASWVMERVDSWEEWRNTNYDTRWDEYYRLWRGFWTDNDRNRAGERSKIISPELAQSIETCVAELEDATFIRDRWIDISEDVEEASQQQEMDGYVRLLLEDYTEYGVTQSVSEIYLNGALYGTGIGKIVVDRVEEPVINQRGLGNLSSVSFDKKYRVKLIPIAPRNFVIDPVARNIDEALGCAHVLKVPMSVIQKKVSDGIYKSIPVYDYKEQVDRLQSMGEFNTGNKNVSCKVVEWHGLVPKRYIDKKEELFDDLDEALKSLATLDTTIKSVGKEDSDQSRDDNEEMVEAIVTIVNDQYVARAVANPFLFGDRSIIAYQHDTVPNRFWGRGVAEKGYNPQKALDAEIRARIDALALSTHPMMGIDASKIPRGERFEVRPGRNILCSGNPQEALFPLKFQPPDPHTFQQTGELREMIQRATGGYELPAMAQDANRMAATSMSMVVGSMIKRSRRTLSNIEREFLTPLVKKSLYRYMQFDPKRFPMKDYKFRVRASMGIMAREFEQGQMISLLSTVPHESPAYWMLIKGIFENSSIDTREDMVKQADDFLKKSMNPPPPPPDPKIQIETLKLAFEDKKHKDMMDAKAVELMQADRRIAAEAKHDEGSARFDAGLALLELVKAETEKQRANADSISKIMLAEAAKLTAEANAMRVFMSEGQPKTVKTSKSPDGSESREETDEIDYKQMLKDIQPILKLLADKNKVPGKQEVEIPHSLKDLDATMQDKDDEIDEQTNKSDIQKLQQSVSTPSPGQSQPPGGSQGPQGLPPSSPDQQPQEGQQ
jgi:hypothetical protein